MSQEHIIALIIEYWSLACLACTLLMQVLPHPEEINSRRYGIFFGVVKRFANSGFRESARSKGNGK